jgi:DNA-binding protein HU-beta
MMKKAEFIKGMAEKYEITQKQAGIELNHVLNYLEEVLAEGEGVNLTGYVKFKVKEVQERYARNPQNGEKVVVPQHRQVRASIGTKLKAAVK